MSESATTRLGLGKQGTGDNNNTWGTVLNGHVIDMVDAAIAGMTSFTLSGSKTLTSTSYVTNEARSIFLNVTGGTGGTVTIPSVEKAYLARNNTSGTVILTTGGGTTATVQSGDVAAVVCDATNVYLGVLLNFGASLPKSTGTPTVASHLVTKTYADALAMNTNLPNQSGNSGKFVTTDGSNASWAAITWTLIETLTTTSGTSATSAAIATTGQDLLVVFEGVSFSGGGNDFPQVAVGDGSTFSGWGTCGPAILGTAAWYGALFIPGYLMNAGHIAGSLVSNATLTGSPTIADNGGSVTYAAIGWRVTNGIAKLKFRTDGASTFDAGTIKIYMR